MLLKSAPLRCGFPPPGSRHIDNSLAQIRGFSHVQVCSMLYENPDPTLSSARACRDWISLAQRNACVSGVPSINAFPSDMLPYNSAMSAARSGSWNSGAEFICSANDIVVVVAIVAGSFLRQQLG